MSVDPVLSCGDRMSENKQLDIDINQRRVDIKTGFQCNNRCRFCVQGEKRNEYGNKTTEELLQTLSEAREYADEIVLTGGEVSIRHDFFEIVRKASELGFRVIQIQTNGRLAAVEDFADKLVEAGATEFAPALHGHTAEIHDALTMVPGSFKQTARGIINMKQRGLPVILNSVICKANAPYLVEMAKLFVKLRVDQYQFAFVHGVGTAGDNIEEVVPRFSEIQETVLAALQVGIDAGVRCMTEAIPLCFLPGYESFAAEWIIPRTRIFDADWVIEDYTQERWNSGKAHGPACTGCRFERMCEGPWHDYPDHYGWDEFTAVPPLERGSAAEGPAE